MTKEEKALEKERKKAEKLVKKQEKKAKKETKQPKKTLDIEILDEEPKKEKKHSYTVFLIISIVLLLGALGLCGYIYYQNNILNKEVQDLENNIVKVKEKIANNDDEIKEKENEYVKLQEELKEKVEELNIWKETTEKLKKALE